MYFFSFSRLFTRTPARLGLLTLGATLSLLAGVSAPFGTPAAHATTVSDRPSYPTLTYWDNWTDTQGVSHLSHCQLTAFHPFNGQAIPATHREVAKIIAHDKTNKNAKDKTPPPSPPNAATPPMIWSGMNPVGGVTVTTVVQPPNWAGDWSPTQHAKWVVPMAGTYRIEAMDGQSVELNPGDLLLIEDMKSKRDKESKKYGHRANNTSSKATALLITQLNGNTNPTYKACSQH